MNGAAVVPSGGASISVIVPARNEAEVIASTLARLHEPAVLEVIVVDGRSEDATAEIARPLADRVISSMPGRARQMNAGAKEGRGPVLFFLHADTLVPDGFSRAIVDALADPEVVGGRFDVEIDASGLALRFVSSMINVRSRATRLFTGDQGLFLRRATFERLGGFPDVPLLEDLMMSMALKRLGRIASLRSRVRTSGRRWQRDGIISTVLRMWTIRALFFAGVSPARLRKVYRDVR